MTRPIGIMDSGVGGLTVAKEIIHALPSESIIYFADSLNCPYGPQSTDSVYAHTKAAVDFLIKEGAKTVIIACNTATAAVMPSLRDEVDVPLYGVINPGALGAVRKSTHNEVMLLATEGTVKSRAYDEAIADFDSDIKLTSVACPEFVNLIESGEYRNKLRTEQVISNKLEAYKDSGCDTIILGCTHFPLIEKEISAFFNDEKHMVDAGFETVNIALSQLHRKNLLNTHKETPKHIFFVHGKNDTFETILNTWIPNIDYSIEEIYLTKEH